jgi:N-acetylmuramoyl-L-alanine amidase
MKSGSSYTYWHSTITFLKPKQAGEKLVVIDPGHGGADSGAAANDVEEKDLNLDIAERLKDLFAGSGVRVYLTRSDDSYVGLGERTAAANMMDADLFLSIHNNAYYSSFNGTETFYYTSPQTNGGLSASVFAGILQKYMISDLGLYDRGVKQNTFSVLKNAEMPSALVEVGFITNTGDVAKLKDPVFRQKIALALYKALMEALAKID